MINHDFEIIRSIVLYNLLFFGKNECKVNDYDKIKEYIDIDINQIIKGINKEIGSRKLEQLNIWRRYNYNLLTLIIRKNNISLESKPIIEYIHNILEIYYNEPLDSKYNGTFNFNQTIYYQKKYKINLFDNFQTKIILIPLLLDKIQNYIEKIIKEDKADTVILTIEKILEQINKGVTIDISTEEINTIIEEILNAPLDLSSSIELKLKGKIIIFILQIIYILLLKRNCNKYINNFIKEINQITSINYFYNYNNIKEIKDYKDILKKNCNIQDIIFRILNYNNISDTSNNCIFNDSFII